MSTSGPAPGPALEPNYMNILVGQKVASSPPPSSGGGYLNITPGPGVASSTLTTSSLSSQSHEAVDKEIAEIIGVPCSTASQTFTTESLVQYSQLDFTKTEAMHAINLRPNT